MPAPAQVRRNSMEVDPAMLQCNPMATAGTSHSSTGAKTDQSHSQHRPRPRQRLPENGWVALPSYNGYLPALAFASQAEQPELFEKNVFVHVQARELFAWLGFRLRVATSLLLHRFPFDRQRLRIGITCRDALLTEFALDTPPPGVDTTIGPSFRVTTYHTAWSIERALAVKVFHSPFQSYFKCSFLVERRPAFFLWNFMLTTYTIVMANCSVVAISPDNLADRLSVTVTLLLTLVAGKFLGSSYIPIISYLTLLDMYTISALLVLFISMAEEVFAASCSFDTWRLAIDASTPCVGDRIFHLGMGAAWSLYHIAVLAMQQRFRVPWDQLTDQRKRQDAIAPQVTVYQQ